MGINSLDGEGSGNYREVFPMTLRILCSQSNIHRSLHLGRGWPRTGSSCGHNSPPTEGQ
jgi:hypothetical protein